ncbi:MAG: hypothetical protein UV73_C0004G0079 [Candidatus Gottesmanbacteria bacterium GW2011_GWA2_43_14]|uniref:Uncharacterized protein n=1 Tax=Candidatus Gottesmanbacteria bacterium GW2011_GWA2_43_14 TaxID=1618443 RepID=A0A0G1DK25_9BACT|nr:MAG: hypothetical protein UV73_C0004G0079 [Candidatus Gottesmanbacteria bacterium GW2011_GWA2_43_14]
MSFPDEPISISAGDLYPKSGQIDRLNKMLAKWNRPPPTFEEKNFFTINKSQATQELERLTERMKDPDYRRKIEEGIRNNPEIGIIPSEEDWQIFPTNLAGILDRKQWKHVLIHQGYIFGGDDIIYNNEQLIEEKGIWGNPAMPSYVAPMDSIEVQPNYIFPDDAKRRRPVTIYVNPDKLTEFRNIWVDPEQFFEKADPEHPSMNAFYVIGGIPAEAIISFSDHFDPSLF